MTLEKDAEQVVKEAFLYAEKNRFEYVTPETLLLAMCTLSSFQECFASCGGDVEELSEALAEYLKVYVEKVSSGIPEFSQGSSYLLLYAESQAKSSGREEICLSHLVNAMFELNQSFAVYYITQQDVSEAELLEELSWYEEEHGQKSVGTDMGAEGEQLPGDDGVSGNDDGGTKTERIPGRRPPRSREAVHNDGGWQVYAPCLNDLVQEANPLIGREEELERTMQILCRKEKNNPLHIGEPGVGKTALTYGLVQRINAGNVPKELEKCRIFSLDLGGMLAGTQYRGDFEKRFKKVLAEIGKEESPIIYIDEIHNLSGAGAVGESSFDASNLLKPYLTDGHIRFIGATTFEEYKKHFEKNKSLVRRFQNVEIKEPSEAETVEILEGLREKYETFHGVTYEKGVFEYAVSMSARHIHERYLPDKAIDLIDEAGAYRKLHPEEPESEVSPGSSVQGDEPSSGNSGIEGEASPGTAKEDKTSQRIVDKTVIAKVLTSICRVPVETVATENTDGLANLEERLKCSIFGQDEAVSQVVNAIKFSKAGLLEEGKPLASLLFVGPTGVGKTEIARCLAKELGTKLVRFDMSEYGEKHAVAKLIGSPAGYVGYEEGGLLTEEIRKNPSCVLLLDEIEKAHPDIFNVLLQVMDYATLTDNQGRKADFRNITVIMTSNAGASRLGKAGIGFTAGSMDTDVILEEVKRTFQPEFRNRLSKVVVFRGMDEDMAGRVVGKKVKELADMLLSKKIRLTMDEEAGKLIRKKGISPEFGAREVDRVIRNEIKPLFVDEILFGGLKNGGELTVTVKEGGFSICIES